MLQRVSRAAVRVGGITTGEIQCGYLLLVGFSNSDGEQVVSWMAEKVLGLRLFGDPDGKLNLSLSEVGGSILVVSQFTLYGDASRGRRPSFIDAARPEVAVPMYDEFVKQLRLTGVTVETGQFGAMMEVDLVNDGPVTIWLEK